MTYETYQHPSLLLFFCCGNRRRNRSEYVQPLRKSSHFQFVPPKCWRVSRRMAVGDSELFGQSFSGRLILSCCTKATGIADIKIDNHRCSNNKSGLKSQEDFKALQQFRGEIYPPPLLDRNTAQLRFYFDAQKKFCGLKARRWVLG